ncbi:uncharacterized protein EDB93DRAFT_1116580 [Suillus bovinus]|uniref:uncharacterized protein n=1 Tax=Suillus bovinus TaxID=48563 RepID=UPI001B86024B|nr:uncharacterized protein EDB93DRAFT_1116580 [Suillus bovinus]KAG2158837.1 hypothetical protein EDB93DRAFT_1116580 [Suillus bovinus]
MAVQLSVDSPVLSEKSSPGPLSNEIPLNCRSSPNRSSRQSHHLIPMRTSFSVSSSSLSASQTLPQSQRYVRPRGLRIWNLFKQWLPIFAYGATSLGFILAIAFWKTEVLDGLEYLSHWLRNDEHFGYAVLFCLIFITTFPPLPLYSTLITLSGYTFGPWIGAAISYCAALSGAVVVFWLSRTFLREPIGRWLSSTRTLCRAVRAVERKPQLLFLVRLAPYPYNVLNALLAATPTLTMRTYVICTALSLFKVIIHTSIGAGIRSFGAKKESDVQEEEDDTWSKVWTIGGILMCVALFIYISLLARRAVDDELDDEIPRSVSEERVAFLDAEDDDTGSRAPRLPLTLQSNMSEAQLVSPHRVVSSLTAA